MPSSTAPCRQFSDLDAPFPSLSFSRFFETFSFLPPLSDQEIARQVQYLLNNGWTPCIEFESADKAYADSHGWTNMDYSVNAGYYDNRYWVMWKLPMYGCTNPEEVLAEIRSCTRAFPECFIRVAGFDNIKQVQCSSFLAHRPSNDRTFAPVNGRQAGDSPMGGAGGYGAPPPPSSRTTPGKFVARCAAEVAGILRLATQSPGRSEWTLALC